MTPTLEGVFGNRSALYVLLFLQNYGEGHASRIAKTFDVSVMGIQRQLNRLEDVGVLVSRMVGRARVFGFDERSPTVRNLRCFLEAELKLLPAEIVNAHFRQRQRPRRAGKPLR